MRSCKLENGICIGCNRTVFEISQWTKLSEEERQAIIARLKYND